MAQVTGKGKQPLCSAGLDLLFSCFTTCISHLSKHFQKSNPDPVTVLDIRRFAVQSQTKQTVQETLSQKYSTQNRDGGEAQV
jgi:signal recognition particle GTPase